MFILKELFKTYLEYMQIATHAGSLLIRTASLKVLNLMKDFFTENSCKSKTTFYICTVVLYK